MDARSALATPQRRGLACGYSPPQPAPRMSCPKIRMHLLIEHTFDETIDL